SFVGLAAVLVGIGGHLHGAGGASAAARVIHDVEIFVGVFIGAVTFTGSLVAFGKLQELLKSKPLLLPGRHLINVGLVVASAFLGVLFVGTDLPGPGLTALVVMTVLAAVLGAHLVLAIGGADMPV